MCQTCWEDHDSPTINTPAVRNAAELIHRVYQHEPAGGYLHVVIDDWNLDDHSLNVCIQDIHDNELNYEPHRTALQAECAEALRALTTAERASALALEDGYWNPEGAAA